MGQAADLIAPKWIGAESVDPKDARRGLVLNDQQNRIIGRVVAAVSDSPERQAVDETRW